MSRIPTDELLDEWVMLRDEGVKLSEAARRIGISAVALDARLCRALRRGDRRGSRSPFGNEPVKEPARHEFPITDPGFNWKRTTSARANVAPCSTCGAPLGAYCVTRWGKELWKLHSARRSALSKPQLLAA